MRRLEEENHDLPQRQLLLHQRLHLGLQLPLTQLGGRLLQQPLARPLVRQRALQLLRQQLLVHLLGVGGWEHAGGQLVQPHDHAATAAEKLTFVLREHL